MNGRLIVVFVLLLSSIFAFSAASFKRCRQTRSSRRFLPYCFLNRSAIQSMMSSSMSSPPRWLSPFVDFTSKTPSPNSRMLTSNVPPPKSKTRTVWSCPLSRPYASAAAVGSLMTLKTSRPAMRPASFVAWRWLSVKYAGHVMTAFLTGWPRYASASAFSFCRIIALTSCGAYDFSHIVTLKSSPMWRLMLRTVCSGFVIDWLRATLPTRRSPSCVMATTLGVVRSPSALGMMAGLPPSRTATALNVVPKSIPMTFS